MQEYPSRFHIGTQKAGSTLFYNLLKTHKAVTLSKRSEISFFTKHFPKGKDWYRDVFPEGDNKVDMSPAYFKHGAVVAELIKDFYKHPEELRFLLILRNPVDYIASHFRMHRLHRYFEKRPSLYPNPTDDLLTFLKRHPSYADRGHYYALMNEWLTFFSREQFLVVLFEDFVKDTNVSMESILSFFDLPQKTFVVPDISRNTTLKTPWLHRLKSRVVRNEKLKDSLKGNPFFGWVHRYMLSEQSGRRLSSEERIEIASYVSPDVEKLVNLGIDTSQWKDFS